MWDDIKNDLSSFEILPPRIEQPAVWEGNLDYNGLLQLECPECGFVNGGRRLYLIISYLLRAGKK